MVTFSMMGLLLLLNFALPQSCSAQDTLFPGSFPSHAMKEQFKILEQAYKEQFKNFPVQMDSLFSQSSRQLKMLLSDTAMQQTFQKQLQAASSLFGGMLKDTALWNRQKQMINQLHNQQSAVIDSHSTSLSLPLEGESNTKELSVEVGNEVSALTLTLKGEVKSGRLKLEILDPKGKNQGGYTIEGNGRGRSEPVSGVSVKQYPSPENGVWKVKVISTKAVGKVTLISNQKP